MYITYEMTQFSWTPPGSPELEAEDSQLTEIIPKDLPKPDFMPTKLVRISDMEVVDGSQVNEGYCALSYSWNQSGDMVIDEKTRKYKRIDEGKHKIISCATIVPEMVISKYELPLVDHFTPLYKRSKLSKIFKVFKIMEFYNYYFTRPIKYVKFEGIIQQLCQQFNIKYIWYDQLCINQDNKEQKQHEIGNMHHIYENAYCTVALVPDYSRKQILDTSEQQYFKRLWTLEEAIKSKRLLFVGRDKHECEDETIREVTVLTKSSSELNVSQILYHAHQRASTKDHDRVFALIHLFPEFMDEINIDYDLPLEDLMIQFYGLLAKKDISILLFQNNRDYGSTIEKYKFLPSWTGVNGEHFTNDITTTSFQNYNTIGKTMNVTTTYVTNNQSIDDDYLSVREDIPIPDKISGDHCIYILQELRLCILVQLSETNEMKRILLPCNNGDYYFGGKSFFDKISKKIKQLSRFMEVKKENLCWCNEKSDDYRMATRIDFGDLTDSLDDPSAQYVILSEISFKSNEYYNRYYYSVIKKKEGEEYYKAIGCCFIENNENFFSDCNLPKETFLIQ